MKSKKPIHLLYVPTLFCNMSCSYCYLGELTNKKIELKRVVETLQLAIDKFTTNGYIPYNLSFHGGEVTTLPSHTLEELFEMTKVYYEEFADEIGSFGFSPTPIHIKTNLYNLKAHHEILLKYKVSISGSVDLPLSLHEKYRLDKQGNSTLPQIKESLRWLATYPHHAKISCVVTKEHLREIEAFIADIQYIHYDIGLDMTKFNVMFSFDSLKNAEKFTQPIEGTEMLNHEEQVLFYKKIYQEFEGTALDEGLRTHWFKEFTPDYCCSAVNCGNKFFLIESDGKVSSCPRGQSSETYSYGNILSDDIEQIITNGWRRIERNENRLSIDRDCMECDFFPYCNLGCTFVRDESNLSKSYTCHLQKEIYRDNPQKYPPYSEEYIAQHVKAYCYRNKISMLDKMQKYEQKEQNITPELYEKSNALSEIIQRDKTLQSIYSSQLFYLEVDNQRYTLSSQILKNRSEILFLEENSVIYLYFHHTLFSINSTLQDEVNNYLHMMVLSGNPVVYGDEGRSKQEHLFDYSLYKGACLAQSERVGEYYKFDLSPLFGLHQHLFLDRVKNNLFFTSKTMREYHYSKQRKNAFYHIQAINLPFANIEFFWL